MNSLEELSTEDAVRGMRSRVFELGRLLEGSRSQIEERASVLEQMIEEFFEQSLVMFVTADLVEGRFLRVNQRVCDVLGFSEQELIESSFLDRVHPADRLETMHVMERLVAGQPTAGFRNRHLAADRQYRVFDWTATVDPDRELCYAVAMDVTNEAARVSASAG